MGLLTCLLVGILVGIMSGVILLATLASLARKLRASANSFPTAEIGGLTALPAFMGGSTLVKLYWFTIADLFCNELYFLGLAAVFLLISTWPIIVLIRVCVDVIAGNKQ